MGAERAPAPPSPAAAAPRVSILQHGPRELTRRKGWRPAEGRSAALGRESLEREGPRKLGRVGCNGNVQSTFGLRRIRIRDPLSTPWLQPAPMLRLRSSFLLAGLLSRRRQVADRCARDWRGGHTDNLVARVAVFKRKRRRQDDKGDSRREEDVQAWLEVSVWRGGEWGEGLLAAKRSCAPRAPRT